MSKRTLPVVDLTDGPSEGEQLAKHADKINKSSEEQLAHSSSSAEAELAPAADGGGAPSVKDLLKHSRICELSWWLQLHSLDVKSAVSTDPPTLWWYARLIETLIWDRHLCDGPLILTFTLELCRSIYANLSACVAHASQRRKESVLRTYKGFHTHWGSVIMNLVPH